MGIIKGKGLTLEEDFQDEAGERFTMRAIGRTEHERGRTFWQLSLICYGDGVVYRSYHDSAHYCDFKYQYEFKSGEELESYCRKNWSKFKNDFLLWE